MSAQIVTARLLLRPFTPSDVDELLELRHATRVFEFLDPEPTPSTVEGTLSTIDQWSEIGARPPGYGYWRVGARSGRFIGTVFLLPGVTQYPRFGGLSLPQTWGSGYALESSAALLEFAFRCLRVTGVIAYTQQKNRSARSSLALCGFLPQSLPSLGAGPTIAYFLSMEQWALYRELLVKARNATDPRSLLRLHRRAAREVSVAATETLGAA